MDSPINSQIIYQILLRADLPDVLSACASDPIIGKICLPQNFWQDKLRLDFNLEVNLPNLNYLSLYAKRYSDENSIPLSIYKHDNEEQKITHPLTDQNIIDGTQLEHNIYYLTNNQKIYEIPLLSEDKIVTFSSPETHQFPDPIVELTADTVLDTSGHINIMSTGERSPTDRIVQMFIDRNLIGTEHPKWLELIYPMDNNLTNIDIGNNSSIKLVSFHENFAIDLDGNVWKLNYQTDKILLNPVPNISNIIEIISSQNYVFALSRSGEIFIAENSIFEMDSIDFTTLILPNMIGRIKRIYVSNLDEDENKIYFLNEFGFLYSGSDIIESDLDQLDFNPTFRIPEINLSARFKFVCRDPEIIYDDNLEDLSLGVELLNVFRDNMQQTNYENLTEQGANEINALLGSVPENPDNLTALDSRQQAIDYLNLIKQSSLRDLETEISNIEAKILESQNQKPKQLISGVGNWFVPFEQFTSHLPKIIHYLIETSDPAGNKLLQYLFPVDGKLKLGWTWVYLLNQTIYPPSIHSQLVKWELFEKFTDKIVDHQTILTYPDGNELLRFTVINNEQPVSFYVKIFRNNDRIYPAK